MDWRFLDLRQRRNNLIFRVQTTLEHAMRTYWIDRDYVEVHSPKLMAIGIRIAMPSCSSSSTSATRPRTSRSRPQFFKQMAQVAGFGKIFEIGPAFRADPSFTSRHATEFTSDRRRDQLDRLATRMSRRCRRSCWRSRFTAVKDKHGAEIEELFGLEVVVPADPVPAHPARRGARDRRRAAATRFPAPTTTSTPRASVRSRRYVEGDLRPRVRLPHRLHLEHPAVLPHARRRDRAHEQLRPHLQRRRDHDGRAARAPRRRADRAGREKGLDPEELDFYLDFFRYGVPPHGGFGMGLARVLMLLLGESSIREVTYLFRGPTRLAP